MRPSGFNLSILLAMVAVTSTASAQDYSTRRTPRASLVISDGLGVNAGGVASPGSLWQLFRVSGVVAIVGHHGVEVSAMRAQELLTADSRINDPSGTVKGDGLFLSYARLSPQRGGGFPGVFSLGAGLVRRATSDPGTDRDTWGFQAGLESDLFTPAVEWADFTAGARMLAMPSNTDRRAFLVAITLGIRIG
jgi:hypothetical protein